MIEFDLITCADLHTSTLRDILIDIDPDIIMPQDIYSFGICTQVLRRKLTPADRVYISLVMPGVGALIETPLAHIRYIQGNIETISNGQPGTKFTSINYFRPEIVRWPTITY
jgi:hypothetical protein